MNRSSISYSFLLAFLLTLFCMQGNMLQHVPLSVWVVIGSIVLMTGVMIMIVRRWVSCGIVAMMTVAGASLALLITANMTSHDATDTLSPLAREQKVTIAGIIVDDSDRRPTNERYTVDATLITEADGTVRPVHGRVLVVDYNNWPGFSYGDAVIAKGKLSKPGLIEDFDYGRYLSIAGIHSVMYRATVTKLESGHRSAIIGFLFTVKRWFEGRIAKLFPEPHASLVTGLLTGSRGMLPETLTEAFKATGLTHIIAISGFNITIILTLLSRLLFWMPRRMRLVPLIVGISAFTVFTGASASVVRAAIMGILGLIALEAGRQAQSRLLILWTAFFMTLWNPMLLWWDAGFQLSFLAVIGITELTPHIDALLKKMPDTFAIRTSLAATLGAQLATYPLIAYLFHRISIIGILANLLVAPLVPIAMLFGFLGTMISTVMFPLGQLIGFLGYIPVDLIIRIATLGAMVPYGNVSF